MGVVLDTTVFIDLERALLDAAPRVAVAQLARQIENVEGPGTTVAMSSISASELLQGVIRATPQHRERREAFVEGVLAAVPVLPFDLRVARVHAVLWADLAASGSDVGPHDRLVAATALAFGWAVGTANVRHFERVPGLQVIDVRPSAADRLAEAQPLAVRAQRATLRLGRQPAR